jgi:hypothetical protein
MLSRRRFIYRAGLLVPLSLGIVKAASPVPQTMARGMVVSGGGGGISSLTDISDLYVWYKANTGILDGSGNPVVHGSDVQTWQDQSGNARHITAPAAGNRPRWDNSIRGSNGGISFSSSKRLVVAFGSTLSGPLTHFCVVKTLAGTGTFAFISDGDDATNRHALLKTSAEKFEVFAASALDSTANLAASTDYILTGICNNSTNGYNQINNATPITGSTGANSLDGLTLGASNSGATTWTGYIYEYAIYNRALNSTEIGQVQTYFNSASRFNGIY